MPKISIVVPVYNEEQWLGRCVESVFEQTFTDWEMIMVDDGSTDRSPQMCDEYAAQDSRVVVVHQENKAYSGARNTALEIVRGDYITFLDADDFFEPHSLEYLYNTMMGNDVDIVIGGKCIIAFKDETHKEVASETIAAATEDFYYFDTKDLDRAVRYMVDICGALFYCLWGNLYKADIIREHGLRYNTNLFVQEDVNFTYQYLYYTNKCVATKELVYNYCREANKDDVCAKPVINQHRGCEYSLQSFHRMAYKFQYSEDFCTYMYSRLSWQYVQLSSKIHVADTGLSEEEKQYHVYAQADEFIFRFYAEKLKDVDEFWADMYKLRQADDLEGIYLRFGQKIKDEGFPWLGDGALQ